MSFNIEKITQSNFANYKRLLSMVQREVLESLASWAEHKLYGANCNGESIGIVWGSPASDTNGLYIHQLYVLKAFRRQQVASRLVECFEKERLLFRYQSSDSLNGFLASLKGSLTKINVEFRAENLDDITPIFKLSTSKQSEFTLLPLAETLATISPRRRLEMEQQMLDFEVIDKSYLSYDELKDSVFLSPFISSNNPLWGVGCFKGDELIGWICGEMQSGVLFIRRAYIGAKVREENILNIFVHEVAKVGCPIYWEVRFWSKSFQDRCIKYHKRLKIEIINIDYLKIVEV